MREVAEIGIQVESRLKIDCVENGSAVGAALMVWAVQNLETNKIVSHSQKGLEHSLNIDARMQMRCRKRSLI